MCQDREPPSEEVKQIKNISVSRLAQDLNSQMWSVPSNYVHVHVYIYIYLYTHTYIYTYIYILPVYQCISYNYTGLFRI